MVRKILVRTFIGLVLIMLYLPIVWMIIFSFTETPSFSEWSGFSFNNYINLFSGKGPNAGKIQEAIVNTLFVGFFVSLLSTVLGTLGAIGLHAIHSKRIKAVYNTANQIPMINSEIVTAIALALVFNLFATMFKINDGSWGMTAFKLIRLSALLTYFSTSCRDCKSQTTRYTKRRLTSVALPQRQCSKLCYLT